MTTGEKIAKLRKEKNLTQEQLAEIMGVTRQSVSKWEMDIAFPETSTLIALSKLYECSIDYLLKEERVEVEEIKEIKTTLTKNNRRLFFALWSGITLVIYLIFYSIPYVEVTTNFGFRLTFGINIYEILSSNNYLFGNFVILIALFLMLGFSVLGGLIAFHEEKPIYFIWRKRLAIAETALWIFLFIIYFQAFQTGMLMMIILSTTHTVCLFKIKQHRIQE